MIVCLDCTRSIEAYPCVCGYQPKTPTGKLWLVQYCGTPGCDVRIRVPASQPLAHPRCKWCDEGISLAVKPTPWPAGMPDPTLPWPWMTEKDREHKLRTPYWKERLRDHKELYAAWLRT